MSRRGSGSSVLSPALSSSPYAASLGPSSLGGERRKLSLKRRSSGSANSGRLYGDSPITDAAGRLTSRSTNESTTTILPSVTKRRPSSSTIPSLTTSSPSTSAIKTSSSQATGESGIASLQRKLSGLRVTAPLEAPSITATRPTTPKVRTGSEKSFYLGSVQVATANEILSTPAIAPLIRLPSKREADRIDSKSSSRGRDSLSSLAADSSNYHNGKARGLVGLDNIGNTCFMASILQCLSNIPALTDYFLSGSYAHDLNRKTKSKGALADQYSELVKSIWTSTAFSSVRPSRLKQVIGTVASRFVGYEQQDAQEFLRFFIDALHDDLNKIVVKPPYQELKDIEGETLAEGSRRWWTYYNARNNSVPKDLFCGQLRSTVTCKTCSHKSTAFDPFWDLSLPVPKAKKTGYFSRSTLMGSAEKSNITDCLSAFTEEEELSGDECCYCSRCKKHTVSTKSILIIKLPKILVLHLKRFSYSTYRREKLTTSVEIPKKNLDMKDYCSLDSDGTGSCTYDLIAVSNHIGGIGGGHYTACCLNNDDKQWYSFNDSYVSRCTSSCIGPSEPYVLFYKRND